MRILHLETGRFFYGGSQQVMYICSGLKLKGIDSILVCQPNSALSEMAKSKGIRVINLSCKGDLDLLFAFRLWRIICKERPDIVHSHSRRGADFLAGYVTKFGAIPNVISRRVDSIEPKFLSNLRYRLFRKVIVISKKIYDILKDTGIDQEKLVLIRSAVDVKRFKKFADKMLFLKEFNIKQDDFVIASVGQLIQRKGHLHLIEIMPDLIQRYPNIKLIIFGQGKLEQLLRKRCSELGLNQKITFLGFRLDLDDFMPHFDLLVHPATEEGLGVSLLKASASGVPIVSFKTGGVPEIVRDGETGLLANPADREMLQKHIAYFIDNEEYRMDCAARAKKWVTNEFSLEEMISKHIKLYESIYYAE